MLETFMKKTSNLKKNLYLFYGHVKSLPAIIRFVNIFWKPTLRPFFGETIDLRLAILLLRGRTSKEIWLERLKYNLEVFFQEGISILDYVPNGLLIV